MKKRDKFWLRSFLQILFVGLVLVSISIYNIVQFNNSYIQEEKNEINIFEKQIKWSVVPYLQYNDFDALQEYVDDFKNNKELAFRIFDADKNLVIASDGTKSSKLKNDDHRVTKNEHNVWDLYLTSFHDKNLEKVSEFTVKDKKYYLEISLSEEFVINSIVKGQKNILFFSYVCLGLLFLSLIYIFFTVGRSFNQLEDNVIQIAQGNFDTKIELPKLDLLSELTVAIKKMTNKLKNQIILLTRLEKYRSDFISNISHEIKTPITAINSAVEFIEMNSEMSQTNQECFDIIKNQTNSINNLVNDILALSEIDLKKADENKKFTEFNLNSAVEEAIKRQGIVSIPINFECLQNQTDISGNEELVITALSNILSNAIRYSKSDKIDIVLNKKDEGINLSIRDYGIGIAQEHLPRIFERFYRIDKARSRKNGGTGLGLAIVKNIIELHGWKINVTSEISQGTCFVLTIPAK